MHQSLFSYSITKPYPFAWFTPVVVVGFVVFTIIFSMINFVSNGFILISELSENPNSTVAEHQWFQNWPSILSDKSQAICQSLNLPVNSRIFTNQTALTYTITNIWQTDADQHTRQNAIAPSLPYNNNVLENCTVWNINIDLDALDRTANQFSSSEWGATVRSYITCSIQSSNGPLTFNLTQSYDYIPPTTAFPTDQDFLGSEFINRDRVSKASLWWGESLLSAYWSQLIMTMQYIREGDTAQSKASISKGGITFTPKEQHGQDITNPNFFHVDFRFLINTDDPPGKVDIIYPGTYSTDYERATHLDFLLDKTLYPNVWEPADRLAKSAYSTILTDLGQVHNSVNILTNASLLEEYSSVLPATSVGHISVNAMPGPATSSYMDLKTSTGPLKITPSTINARYLCQIPRRKTAGNLFISILVADLVFLQALWQLYIFLIDFFLLRKIPNVHVCSGCQIPREMTSYDSLILRNPLFTR
jgi:hypothetical protein